MDIHLLPDDITIIVGDALEYASSVRPDAVITDPPYSERTHSGHNSAPGGDGAHRRKIDYPPLTRKKLTELFAVIGKCPGWIVGMTDHVLWPDWEQEAIIHGRYTFPPVPLIVRGGRVRINGDGPSNVTVFGAMSRPRTIHGWTRGTKPGWHSVAAERNMIAVGGKPLELMLQIVGNYTGPDDLILDPYCGGGTTLLAAWMLGRRATGIEIDHEVAAKAADRIREAQSQRRLPTTQKVTQPDLPL